jgi:hypothetical protein
MMKVVSNSYVILNFYLNESAMIDVLFGVG